ncbi:hypothetical protein Tco_0051345 [Tanacetum coccineum]
MGASHESEIRSLLHFILFLLILIQPHRLKHHQAPEEPQSPPPLDFVPEPMYSEYIPQEDAILPTKEQPLPAAALPTADSLGYVP